MATNGRSVAQYLTGAFFVATGALHFFVPAAYVRIVPRYIPAPQAMVYLSGIAEVLGGLGLCFRGTRRAAGWWLVALLIAIFPANVNMAINNIQFTQKPLPPVFMWGRLPLQALLIWWVLEASKPGRGRVGSPRRD